METGGKSEDRAVPSDRQPTASPHVLDALQKCVDAHAQGAPSLQDYPKDTNCVLTFEIEEAEDEQALKEMAQCLLQREQPIAPELSLPVITVWERGEEGEEEDEAVMLQLLMEGVRGGPTSRAFRRGGVAQPPPAEANMFGSTPSSTLQCRVPQFPICCIRF